MRYKSSRSVSDDEYYTFEYALLNGFAPDGGLFVPEYLPKFDDIILKKWSSLKYYELAYEIASYFIAEEEIPRDELKKLFEEVYDNQKSNLWSDDRVAPVIRVGDVYIAELFHGPTLAFKDIAMQMVGALMNYFLSKSNDRISVIVATSGDTGPSAIAANIGKAAVECYVLFPQNMVSERQSLQMTTINEPNIHVYEVKNSTSDSLDEVVRSVFDDHKFAQDYKLCTINSFNWARVMLQIVHYFYTYFQIINEFVSSSNQLINICLPTGAMGNSAAGMIAYLLGLPSNKLILSTNQNDVIAKFLASGVFSKNEKIIPSLSPAIDIQVPYNMERILYFACNDTNLTRKWMQSFEENGNVTIPDNYMEILNKILVGQSVSETNCVEIIQRCYNNHRYVLDPHTAVGLSGAEILYEKKLVGLHLTESKTNKLDQNFSTLCLSTAHPAKFKSAIIQSIGHEGFIPNSIQKIEAMKDNNYACIIEANSLEDKLRDDIAKNFNK